MTEAGWTREKPTVAGWYWWRSLNGMIGPEIIQIDNTNGPDTDLEVIGPFGETPLDEWIAESEDEPGEWQGPLSPDSYQQGRVASLVAMKDYLETRADIVEGAALCELLAGNSVKESNERSALAEIHAMQSVIRDLEAQQAQEGK